MASRITVDNLQAIGRGVVLFVMIGVATFGAAAADPAVRTFEVNIGHGHVPEGLRTIKVKQGDMVRIRITADEAVSLHLHGYDIEETVTPGSVAEFSFEAYAAGRFPINAHGGHHGGGHGEPALLRLEVHPR